MVCLLAGGTGKLCGRVFCRRLHSGDDALKHRVHVPAFSDGHSIVKIRVKQRFTVSPGASDGNDLTGSWVWPTARPLLTRLLQSKLPRHDDDDDDTPLRILELGSGCGLLGMALAAANYDVVLTDQAENMDWLRENTNLNGDVTGNRATTSVLSWGNEKHMISLEKETPPFDAIVGSDIIYNPESHPALVDTMHRFALPRKAPVYLGYPKRSSTDDAFFQTVENCFDVEFEQLDSDEKLMLAVCRVRP